MHEHQIFVQNELQIRLDALVSKTTLTKHQTAAPTSYLEDPCSHLGKGNGADSRISGLEVSFVPSKTEVAANSTGGRG